MLDRLFAETSTLKAQLSRIMKNNGLIICLGMVFSLLAIGVGCMFVYLLVLFGNIDRNSLAAPSVRRALAGLNE
jgi:hypothetical protein